MKENRKYYGLTASQEVLFYSQKFTLHKQVNNIFTLLLVEQELDFALMKKAIEHAYRHCDALRIRLARVKGKIKQYFLEKETPKIGMLDFTGRTQEQMDRKLYKLASAPFYLVNRIMSRFTIIRASNGMCGIYLGVSHVILDSWGICVLIKYIMDVYKALKDNTALPTPLYPYEQLLAKDLDYNNTPQYLKDLAFWKQECTRPEPWYTHINGPSVLAAYRKQKRNNKLQGSSGFTLRTRAMHEILTIPKGEIDQIRAYCAERGMPMQALFLLAARTCLSRLNDRQSDVSVYSTVARRGTKQEKQSGGSRVHALIFRTILPESTTFTEAVEQIHSRQNLLYRHADFGLLEVMKLMEDAYHKGDPMASHLSVSVTFQPVQLTLGDGSPCHTKWYCNGVSSQAFYLTVMDDDGTGALRCYYEYQKSIIARQKILDFHADMVKVILDGIHSPDITIGELLDGAEIKAKPDGAEMTA